MERTGGRSPPTQPCSPRLPEISGQRAQTASGVPAWWDHELAMAVAGLPTPYDSLKQGPGACRERDSRGESPWGRRDPGPGRDWGTALQSHPSLPPDLQPVFPFLPLLHDLLQPSPFPKMPLL